MTRAIAVTLANPGSSIYRSNVHFRVTEHNETID
jgi:hypothetical protein